jgi:hypothetical protein
MLWVRNEYITAISVRRLMMSEFCAGVSVRPLVLSELCAGALLAARRINGLPLLPGLPAEALAKAGGEPVPLKREVN